MSYCHHNQRKPLEARWRCVPPPNDVPVARGRSLRTFGEIPRRPRGHARRAAHDFRIFVTREIDVARKFVVSALREIAGEFEDVVAGLLVDAQGDGDGRDPAIII